MHGVTDCFDRFLTIKDVVSITALGRSTIYDLINADKFPRQHPIPGSSCARWSMLDVQNWIQSVKSGGSVAGTG